MRDVILCRGATGVSRQADFLPRGNMLGFYNRRQILAAPLHCLVPLQMTDEISGDGGQILSPDHQVDEPSFEQRVGLMRILWRRNAGGLLDDSGPDKSDLCA